MPAQERRFLVYIQVDQTRIVHLQIMPSQIMETRRAASALGGYNSSCKMVEPDFRAISSGQLSLWNR